MLEDTSISGGVFNDSLIVYDPDSDLGKLAASSNNIVKVKFSAKPTIADYSFKEYKTSKQMK